MLHVDRIAPPSQSSKVDYRLALTMDPLDLDPGFEPQTRARSNTWPLPRPDNFVEEGGKGPPAAPSCEGPKKNSSRRNAWGNMSYADLITQAIQSSPEKRLTLAQIYEWMVQNVAYFKDKGDSNSSAGWKNSIRHNLSLHNRFMRVQNEGTGKSSWWMINPDAKPGKAARRRATSMETHKYEKKRGRVKKKVEALRNNGATPSPSSSVSEGQDLFPESPGGLPHFQQLSPPDPFRPRASSNASSCGRLSPIPAAPDSDIPPLSPIPWTYEHMDRSYTTDHLVKSLSESMKLRCSGGDPDSSFGLSSDCAVKPVSNGARGFGLAPAPPYYASNGEYRTTQSYQPSPSPPQQQVIETVNGRSYTLTRLQSIPQQQSQPSTLCDTYRQMSTYLDTPPPLYKDIKEEPQEEPSCPLSQPSWPKVASYHPQQQQTLLQQPQQQQTSLVNTANHVVGHLLYNSLPQDLDFDPLPGGFECDVDQVIRHELSVEGNLDFNFDSAAATSTSNPSTTLSSTRSWVH